MEEAYTFDDVLIVPQYSEVQSRFDPSTLSPNLDLNIPIISANMDSVTGPAMAIAMHKAGGMGVLHRFYDREEMIKMVKLVSMDVHNPAVSLGIGDPGKVAGWAEQLCEAGARYLVIDVAHGHQQRVLECVEEIRNWIEKDCGVNLIAGNVATRSAVDDLWNAGVDGVKIGIGPGAACTTRETTGIGVPQFSAIWDVTHNYAGDLRIGAGPIVIADGGVKNTGDFCKAIAAGADAVMMGSILAGADESAGEVEYKYNDPYVTGYGAYRGSGSFITAPTKSPSGYKVYRGMASTEARDSFGISASSGYNEHIPEGISGRVLCSGPVADTLDHYKKALQSSMSYVGAENILDYQRRAKFVKVTPSSIIESGPRV